MLKAHDWKYQKHPFTQGTSRRGVSFGNGKKGYILGVGKVGKSLEDSNENVYYVSGLKYSFLSVSQICDKGNEIRFFSDKCVVTCLSTNKKGDFNGQKKEKHVCGRTRNNS